MQVEILKQLLQHLVLLPYVILLTTQKQQLGDGQLAEDTVTVGSGGQRLAAVVEHLHGDPGVERKPPARRAQCGVNELQEGALRGGGAHVLIDDACRPYVGVLGILQRGEDVYAGQLQLVVELVVILRVGLRVNESCEHALLALVDVHHGITARRAEQLRNEGAGEQTDGRTGAEQVVKGIIDTALYLHRVISEKHAAAVGAYLHRRGTAAAGDNVHCHRLGCLGQKLSVEIHGR